MHRKSSVPLRKCQVLPAQQLPGRPQDKKLMGFLTTQQIYFIVGVRAKTINVRMLGVVMSRVRIIRQCIVGTEQLFYNFFMGSLLKR